MTAIFAVAPMLDVTDRHYRHLLRIISKRARLYTEMMVVGTLIYGDETRYLPFDDTQHPVAVQLGGSDPKQLAVCAKMAQEANYDEINLNVGCPSDRVKSGHFGACLMAQPQLVADCVAAMKDAVDIPVTVKTRIGIDDLDSYELLASFVNGLVVNGVDELIVHARKAWLSGLSPKQNREVPPLDYSRVYQLKADFADLPILINGGIEDIASCHEHLDHVDGVMLGRAVVNTPMMMNSVDSAIYHDQFSKTAELTPFDVVQRFLPYVEQQLSNGVYLRHMSRHLLNLFHGYPGAKAFRRYLSEQGPKKDAGIEVIEQALACLNNAADVHERVIHG